QRISFQPSVGRSILFDLLRAMPGHWQLRELAGACVNGASTAAVSPQPPSTTQADAGIAVVASDGSVSAEQEYAGANQAAGVAAMELLGSDASYGAVASRAEGCAVALAFLAAAAAQLNVGESSLRHEAVPA